MKRGKGRFAERLMFRPVPLWLVLLLLLFSFAAMIGFGAVVLHAARGGTRFRSVQNVALALAETPFVLRAVFASRDPFTASPGTEALPAGFWDNPADPLVDSGYLLLSLYDPSEHTSYVQLMRLSDGRVLREYRPDIARLRRDADRYWTPTMGDRSLPFQVNHPDLLPDGGLLFNGNSILARLGVCGEVRWTMPGFHHSIERGPGEGYWVPSVLPRAETGDVRPSFRDDTIAHVGVDGRKDFERASSEIFARNGLLHMVVGRPYTDDPYHLNDIEPVMEDGPHWRRGDLFLSYRSQSLVMLYRPSTGRVLWWRSGPWLSQHDVNIIDDHRISIFDNETIQGASLDSVPRHNRLAIYDFNMNSLSWPFDQAFARLNIRSAVGGRATSLANGDVFAEDTNGGRLVRMDRRGEVRWRFVHGDASGRRYRLAWSRYLDSSRYGQAIAAAAVAHCG